MEYPKLVDKDLRRKSNDLLDEDATAEFAQLWVDEVEFENVEESERSLDVEGSLSIVVISVSILAQDRRRYVRSIVATMDPYLSTSVNRTDMFVIPNIELNFHRFQVGNLIHWDYWNSNGPIDTCALWFWAWRRLWWERCVNLLDKSATSIILEKSKRNRESYKKRGRQFNYNDFDTESVIVRREENISWFT